MSMLVLANTGRVKVGSFSVNHNTANVSSYTVHSICDLHYVI